MFILSLFIPLYSSIRLICSICNCSPSCLPMRYIEDTVMYIDRQPKPVSMATTQTSRTSGDIRPHR
ncbi:hypothetical protein M088_3890 [Bacteroides ovatus str. 3725 D1 iv]|nr:hypothetical protein M088_3890 [Bacteroides ovatus str. 3725 D1 iv]